MVVYNCRGTRHRAHSKRKYKDKEGTIHCAPTIQIQIKTINLYFRGTDVPPIISTFLPLEGGGLRWG